MNSEDVKKMEMSAAAERAASRYAPPPPVDPTVGGCMGAMLALVVMFVFSLVAGFEVGAVPVFATLVIFFVLTTLYLSSPEKQHRKATVAELERLKKENSN